MRISIAYVTLKLYSKRMYVGQFFSTSLAPYPQKKPNQLHTSQQFTSQLQPPQPNFTTY